MADGNAVVNPDMSNITVGRIEPPVYARNTIMIGNIDNNNLKQISNNTFYTSVHDITFINTTGLEAVENTNGDFSIHNMFIYLHSRILCLETENIIKDEHIKLLQSTVDKLNKPLNKPN